MRQASRRSWRIGQKRPVKVVFMAYRNTLQADALKLVAKKLQSSLAVEGELPEDGLAAFGDDLMLALARKIVSGDEDNADSESVEQVFAQARDAEASAEEFLVDGGWQVVQVGPEAVGFNGKGHHANGNGLPTAGDESNGNGHQEEPAQGQQSLFSWSEFLAEEPARSKSRNGKAKPGAPSLFQWALEQEQERDEEPVGAGR